MGNGPFKLKGWSPFTKTSPAKDDPHTTTEDHATHEVEPHWNMGTVNTKGTAVVDEKGNWVGIGDRPDLVKKGSTQVVKGKTQNITPEEE